MADEIYVVTRLTPTPQRFDLSQQERDDLVEKWKAAGAGESVMGFGLGRLDGKGMILVHKYPSRDAWREYLKAIWELQIHKYFTLEHDLCFKAGE